MDQLIAVHDARMTAQLVLSAYPGLQQTVASATLAVQFANDAEATLKQSLSTAGLSGTMLADVEKALTAVDAGGWSDSAKAASTQQAVAKVVGVLAVAGGTAGDNGSLQQVQTAMASWLDADKQRRYWAGLAAEAEQSIATLDGTLGALSNRVGVDVAGAAGAASEKALLAKLSADPGAGQWKAALAAAVQDPSARIILKYAGTP
jgi:hypothetical protein